MLHPSFHQRFVATFVPQPFRDLARQTGWLKRQGKIDAFEFLTSQVFGQLSPLRQTLVSQAQCLAEPVTPQAIHERYNSSAVAYFQAAFAHTLAQTLDWSPARPQALELQEHFRAVSLLDSTCFDGSETLQDIFPSCGGERVASRLESAGSLIPRGSGLGYSGNRSPSGLSDRRCVGMARPPSSLRSGPTL